MRVIPLLGFAAVLLLAACPDREVSELTPDQGKVEYKDIPVTVNRDLDLLFVIDNSGSMGEEQASLRANFPKFIDVLKTIQGGLPNIHIGVITSDMGTMGGPPIGNVGSGGCAGTGADGVMRNLPGQQNIRYISDIKDEVTGVRTRNYGNEDQLSSVFSQMATVGSTGCGFEMHLGAMRRALDNPANGGFIRPNAYLAVIFIADEDDCSLKEGQGQNFFGQPVINDIQSYGCFKLSTICDDNGSLMDQVGPRTGCKSNEASTTHEQIAAFANFLRSKKDPELIIVGGIIGNDSPVAVTTRTRNNRQVPDVAPSCTYQAPGGGSQLQRAFPGVRLTQFLNQFTNSTSTTICKSDLSDGLLQIAELLKTVIGSPCINNKLAEPYQCSVLDVANFGKPGETRSVIGQCEAGVNKIPCWKLENDADKCGTKLALNIERGGQAPAPNTHVIANCVTE